MKGCTVTIAATVMLLCGCTNDDFTLEFEKDRVFIYYNGGYNNLSGFMKTNMESMESGYIPSEASSDIFLTFTHYPAGANDYDTPTNPALVRIFKRNNEIIKDTLVRYSSNVSDINAQTVCRVLNYVKERFPSHHYGMLFSSHATGWLPPDRHARQNNPSITLNSIGAKWYGDSKDTDEMDIRDFAAAIPMKLDYLIMDCCFSGAVEIAYELKDKCSRLIVSPSELPGQGLEYEHLLSRLFDENGPELEAVCTDYARKSSSYTIALVDCSKLGQLAECAGIIIANHRAEINDLDRYSVQRYYRLDEHGYFWDLRDIMAKAGASAQELEVLDNSLSQSVLYSDHSNAFMGLNISTCCGLSMYIPFKESMNEYYRNLAWNEAVGLVE